MNFLAPLFLVGALAIAGPVIFHLLRQSPRVRVLFSSLMFLRPTPPRPTRRRRLDNLLLLLLRCLALVLLALGFSRPFRRQTVDPNPPAGPGKRIVLMLDTSASMRRAGLWAEARAELATVLERVTPADSLAVFTFDRTVRSVVSFAEWEAMAAGDRTAGVLGRFATITPGWAGTQLAAALMQGTETLVGSDEKSPGILCQVVLVSDLQEGGHLEALQSFEWPKGIELSVRPVGVKAGSNAGLQRTSENADAPDAGETLRLRVSNSANSTKEQLQLSWRRPDGLTAGIAPLDVYVPPGQSRMVSVPFPQGAADADRIVLTGDDADFDNTVFVVALPTNRLTVLYLGADLETNSRLPQYFLRRALPSGGHQIREVLARPPSMAIPPAELEASALVIVTDSLPEITMTQLRRHLLAGHTILVSPQSSAVAPTLAGLLGVDRIALDEAPATRYAMLSEIDFRHPAFVPFADARFQDFTKVRFWKHRKLDLRSFPDARVIARFDDGDPAFVEFQAGSGRVMVLTSGWHPEDSQLALSTKFVPLIHAVLNAGNVVSETVSSVLVGEPITLPTVAADLPKDALRVRKPDGTEIAVAGGTAQFADTMVPGIYSFFAAERVYRFAVNVDPMESRTRQVGMDELPRVAAVVAAGGVARQAIANQSKTQEIAIEIESRQKLWRWALVAALLVLLMETLAAGWMTR
ncbi:MAG: VWA domain-containing protein [Pedosphaera sp.]|nr:VWA domain-containing protein [Pedosphaera sp.]